METIEEEPLFLVQSLKLNLDQILYRLKTFFALPQQTTNYVNHRSTPSAPHH